MQIMTQAFSEGGVIPTLHTCDGADVSPSLEWRGAPPGARSFALIVDDPDAPVGTWNHWLLWDIPASVESLPQGWKPGKQYTSGTNDFGKPGYGGPCPPRGHGPHRYFFKLHALDVETLGVPAGSKRKDLDRALEEHVLEAASMMGRYERK